MNGLVSSYYHAGLPPEQRRIIQDDFMQDRIKIISATNAFGMGVDKPDIRLLIHYNMPGTIENYYQEIGRAGRDDIDSKIFLLYEERDLSIQEFFINNNYALRTTFLYRHQDMIRFLSKYNDSATNLLIEISENGCDNFHSELFMYGDWYTP